MTRLTVGIPVFNAMPYLPESMESILRQRYDDFMILAIDDGSTDESLKFLQSIRDRRLRVVAQERQGVTATLNRMLAEVKTPWLVRLDADDVAYPDRLTLIADYIGRYPQSGMFYSLAEYYPKTSVGRFRSTTGSSAQIRELVRSGYLPAICHPTVTLNVEKTISLGGYRFDLHVEDIDLWWRMALVYDIQMIPRVTVGFRQNLQSISSVHLEAQALHTLYIQYLLVSHLYKREPLPLEQVRGALGRLIDQRKLDFKTHMRRSNMELGRGNSLLGVREAGRAFLASPGCFCSRLLDECLPNRSLSRGEPLAVFKHYQAELWPRSQASSTFPRPVDRKGNARPAPMVNPIAIAERSLS